ncbi:Eco57I restriction-modification methylase domain-containing protein [Streptococcaceae bacterium ESL0729]|nr:Eco57I restriction-modification methylase domain-containing protein [Streptococcaceae bacterium ESL0729]
MGLNDRKINQLIDENNLQNRKDVLKFVKENPESLSISELSRIAELVNNMRSDTAAYYTSESILNSLDVFLPYIDKKEIHILEPSVGVGNFLQLIIDKYKYADKLIIEVNDIDIESIELLKLLNTYRNIPDNVEIVYNDGDFLSPFFSSKFDRYDLIIGNPPFLKLNKKNGLLDYSIMFDDMTTNNMSGFFVQKAISMSNYVSFVLPKYFLSNPDFVETRNRIATYAIEKIIDFGEKGFKGVLIETIAVLINTIEKPDLTISYSVTNDFYNEQKQEKLVTNEFSTWLIYRNDFFDKIYSNMIFSVFKVFRDRQLTNSVLQDAGDIRVLKSKNIARDGKSIISISGYDKYIDKDDLNRFSVGNYYERDDVFLSPNMTYYPRVIRKPKDVIVNGSVAILENISEYEITDKHLKFLSSEVFSKFYSIARNLSTRSLNIDSNSVKFFGLYNGEVDDFFLK